MSKNLLTVEQKELLKRALSSGSRLGASDLRLINVDVYRERLGGDWFKYKGIINALAAAAIKAELDKDDFFVETKAGYGIFFFKKNVDEVQVVSDRISERLQRELSREPAFGDPPLGCKATSVNCDDFLRQLEGEAPAQVVVTAPAGSYAPLWHTKLQRVVGSVFAPPPPAVQRRLSDGDYFSAQEAFALHDIGYFSAMLADAYRLHKAGQSTTIVFSLNFQTFCAPKFNKEYMQALRQTPASLLQYLTPRVVRIPPGTAQQLLAAKAHALSGIFKHVVLHSRPLLDQRTFEFVPCSILSTSWKDIERTVTADRAVRTPAGLAKQFSQSAKLLRLNSLISGVDTREAFEAVIGAGVEFISGASVLPFADKPFGQRQLTLSEVRRAVPAAAAHTQADPEDIELV
jgi:hypothetical protein